MHEMVERAVKLLREKSPDWTAEEFAEEIVRTVISSLRFPSDDVVEVSKRALQTFDAKDTLMGALLTNQTQEVKMMLRWNAMIDWMLK